MINLQFQFSVTRDDGAVINFEVDDFAIDYLALRSHFSESICLEVIEQVKKQSGKKCAFVFGNCQKIFLSRMFLRHIEFSRKYFLLYIPAVHLLDKKQFDLIFGAGGQFLQLVDLFISQQIKGAEFKHAPSSTSLMQLLQFGTKVVWIPNIYFDGYFPQVAKKRVPKIDGKTSVELFPYPDYFLDQIMFESKMNPDVEKILDRICAPQFLSREEIQLGIDESFAELRRREWLCDLKISDYIEENFRDKQIFYTTNHPFAFVMFELVRRTLRFIGFKSDNFANRRDLIDEQNFMFSIVGFNIPIYPSVQRFFEFQECERKFWANMGMSQLHEDFRNFQREYIKYCWAEKFTEV